MTYWNEKIETMPKEDLKAMQLELLKELVKTHTGIRSSIARGWMLQALNLRT